MEWMWPMGSIQRRRSNLIKKKFSSLVLVKDIPNGIHDEVDWWSLPTKLSWSFGKFFLKEVLFFWLSIGLGKIPEKSFNHKWNWWPWWWISIIFQVIKMWNISFQVWCMERVICLVFLLQQVIKFHMLDPTCWVWLLGDKFYWKYLRWTIIRVLWNTIARIYLWVTIKLAFESAKKRAWTCFIINIGLSLAYGGLVTRHHGSIFIRKSISKIDPPRKFI